MRPWHRLHLVHANGAAAPSACVCRSTSEGCSTHATGEWVLEPHTRKMHPRVRINARGEPLCEVWCAHLRARAQVNGIFKQNNSRYSVYKTVPTTQPLTPPLHSSANKHTVQLHACARIMHGLRMCVRDNTLESGRRRLKCAHTTCGSSCVGTCRQLAPPDPGAECSRTASDGDTGRAEADWGRGAIFEGGLGVEARMQRGTTHTQYINMCTGVFCSEINRLVKVYGTRSSGAALFSALKVRVHASSSSPSSSRHTHTLQFWW